LVVPDDHFSWIRFWDARRFYLAAVWDETPHFAALTFLPLVILFLSLSIQKRRLAYYVASAISIALAARRLQEQHRDHDCNWRIRVCDQCAVRLALCHAGHPRLIGELGRRMACGSVTALTITRSVGGFLWRYLPRWTSDWRLQFFALFAYLTTSVPFLATFLHRQYLPQPNRYKNEAELALSVLVVFAVRKYLEKPPASIRAKLLFVFLAVAGERVVSHRDILNEGETPAPSARISLAWLKAYGVGAIGISGPNSTEFWKPFRHPARFHGVLPALWSEDGVTIYQVPRRSSSLAHLMPESAVLQRRKAALFRGRRTVRHCVGGRVDGAG
jgi:hypothetical protein